MRKCSCSIFDYSNVSKSLWNIQYFSGISTVCILLLSPSGRSAKYWTLGTWPRAPINIEDRGSLLALSIEQVMALSYIPQVYCAHCSVSQIEYPTLRGRLVICLHNQATGTFVGYFAITIFCNFSISFFFCYSMGNPFACFQLILELITKIRGST